MAGVSSRQKSTYPHKIHDQTSAVVGTDEQSYGRVSSATEQIANL